MIQFMLAISLIVFYECKPKPSYIPCKLFDGINLNIKGWSHMKNG